MEAYDPEPDLVGGAMAPLLFSEGGVDEYEFVCCCLTDRGRWTGSFSSANKLAFLTTLVVVGVTWGDPLLVLCQERRSSVLIPPPPPVPPAVPEVYHDPNPPPAATAAETERG